MFTERSWLKEYFDNYVRQNNDAQNFMHQIENCKFDIRALVDHCTIRTLDIKSVGRLLLEEGFIEVPDGTIDMDSWILQLFYKPGYPMIAVDQPNYGKLDAGGGGGRIIHDWVHTFGDKQFHHIAVRVQEIDKAVKTWTQWGIPFAG